MLNIIKASLYKLFRDKTFQVTLIIGICLAVFTNLIYFAIFKSSDIKETVKLYSGETALVNSLTPTSNFGLTVPINLVVFTIGEFTYGTIRNKIIAGHKKSSIYLSLVVTGFVFTLIMMTSYCFLCWVLGSIFGGVHASGVIGENIGWIILFGFTAYIFIMSFSVFIATITRNIGGSLPIIIIFFVFLGLVPTFVNISHIVEGNVEVTKDAASRIGMWVDPLFILSTYTSSIANIMLSSNTTNGEMIAAGIIVPLTYAALFILLGTYIFSKRDVK